MRELVGEHRLDLPRLEPLQEPTRHRDDGMLLVAPGGERIRHVRVDDRDPRLRQVGQRAQPLDHRMELGRLLRRDDLRSRGCERQLVRRPVLEHGQADDDHEQRHEPHVQHREEDDCEEDVEQAEQAARQDNAKGEPEIPAVRLPFHLA